MLFVQLDANWPDNPKVMDARLEGAGLHAMAMCMAKRMETDGVLYRGHLYRLGADDELIDRMLDIGLFDPVDDDRIRIHGWLDRNPSQGAIDATRTAKAASAKAGNHRRWGHTGSVDNCPRCNPPPDPDPKQNGRSSQGAIPPDSHGDRTTTPVGSLETESKSETETKQSNHTRGEPSRELALVPDAVSSPPATVSADSEFALWWQAYPRKVGKPSALRAWRTARKHTTAAQLHSGLESWKGTWTQQRRPVDKLPHASTWLNDRRWEDPPEDTRRPAREPKSYDAIRRVAAEMGGPA